MNDDYLFSQEDLVNNPTARVPICLVLDVSGSMAGSPIEELQEGVHIFHDAIREDEVARYAAEISIVTFGRDAKRIVDFMPVERQDIPVLVAGGTTPMGRGVNLALDLLDARKSDYRRAGVDCYQPWMVVMTDGEPTDDISHASERIRELYANRELTVFRSPLAPEPISIRWHYSRLAALLCA
ncbi:VWA domain-containing protein [Pantoea sp. Tr-811]|uniref:VWA domain-containing protein n=1 Tax=Pantoea sp. Tr-811 TaxID=2608361 RepID=UPI001962E620|nr:VWA domain-containing protein [Pantoea sp. Tr-811]